MKRTKKPVVELTPKRSQKITQEFFEYIGARGSSGLTTMAVVFIGLGSNLGKRSANIQEAVRLLRLDAEIEIQAVSSVRETKPQEASGPDYLNAAAKLKTDLEPEILLARLQKIENALGRKRLFKNAPRTIDLDILWYAGRVINSPQLTIPHPRMFERDFVMGPLLEIEPNFKNVYHR